MSKIQTQWMTTVQAGRVLGVSRPRVWQLIQEGRLTGELIATRVLLVSWDSVVAEADRRGIVIGASLPHEIEARL